MKLTKVPNWITWPRRDYSEDITQLYRQGARCDAWRAFLQSKTVAAFKRVKGHVIWFNRYENFEKLIVEFDCSEAALRRVIAKLVRPAFRGLPFEFKRDDIYDARAWARLPLNWFADIDEREIPVVQFGIRLPVSVPRSAFTLSHRLKWPGRFAEMVFEAPWLDARFKGRRWAADGTFAKDATRAEMMASLFAQVESRCKAARVTITD
jgi:hypothetical protein